jgi:hypothetical protein
MFAGAGGAAAAAAAIAQAIKASGVLVSIEPEGFMSILSRARDPLVVVAEGGWPKKSYQYLTGYKGLAFFTKSPKPLLLSGTAEVVTAKKIWIPG